MRAIEPLYSDKKVVAVGECGLDHHWPVPREAQLELFEAEIRNAKEHSLPIIVHDREAHEETYALLKKHKPKGVLHAYSGSADDVAWLCPLEAAAAVPDEFLLLETDCPYMAPEPFRGKKSNSAMIWQTAAKIAEVRGVETEALLKMCMENARRLFDI